MDWYIGNEWESQGLHKKVLELDFTEFEKPEHIAKVIIIIEKVENLEGRATKYLNAEQINEEQELEMGSALTPVDCYLETLVKQMFVGERACCSISTKSADKANITVQLSLKKIIESRPIHQLTPSEMYALALRYKENGVAMFKAYPRFAHNYFVRAAKGLISFEPFEQLSQADDGVSISEMRTLFTHIQTNIAACLLMEKRYEDVIYMTEFVESMEEPAEKAVYRRAIAFYHLKEYERAQQMLQKVYKYRANKDFVRLQKSITESWKESEAQFKLVAQRMFS